MSSEAEADNYDNNNLDVPPATSKGSRRLSIAAVKQLKPGKNLRLSQGSITVPENSSSSGDGGGGDDAAAPVSADIQALTDQLITVPLLSNLSLPELRTLAQSLDVKTFAGGQSIVQQNDDGDGFYVIKTGSARIFMTHGDGQVEERGTIRGGDYFGEAALLEDSKRGATVEAMEDTECWFLHRQKFKEMFRGMTFPKRKGVCAEKFSNDVMFEVGANMTEDAMDERRKKTELQAELLLAAVDSNVLFCGMSPEHKVKIIGMMWSVDLPKGTRLFEQGSLGDNFYVIEKGKIYVFTKGPDGKERKTKTAKLKMGQCFGELALMYNTPRNASIVAAIDSKVWTLDRFTFRRILTNMSADKFSKYEEFLSNVSIFSTLSHGQRSKIAEALEERHFVAGECIFEQGTAGDSMYIIADGSVQVRRSFDDEKEAFVIKTLTRGDYFGELALTRSEPRSASIECLEPCDVLELDRTAFSILLGPLESLLKENQQNYVMDHNEMSKTQISTRKRLSTITLDSRARGASVLRPVVRDIRLDDLEPVAKLGKGSFGYVNLVKHKSTGETFALKAVNKQRIVETKQKDHIRNEKDLMLLLDHPNIIRLYCTLKDPNYLYFVLEASLGGEVYTILRTKVCFKNATARFYAASVVLALEYMAESERCIVHRDIKPENLLMDVKGYVKLTDFGFAKQIPEGRTWTLCGTPSYLAPEVIAGKGHGYGVDWWCLGVLIFEMLTGDAPFSKPGQKPMELYQKISAGDYTLPDTLTPAAKDIITSFLQVKPNNRLGVILGGIDRIKSHEWFRGFDFKKLHDRSLRAPIIPFIDNQNDAHNFSGYKVKKNMMRSYQSDGTGWADDF